MTQPQAAPVQLAVANFNPGSYIMVEGKKDSDYFFIVRQGQIKTVRGASAVESEAMQTLNMGDFFGVIAAMTGHPRIESAIAVSQSSLIAVKKNQFGFLIQKNTPLAMKIIRSFSQKLRFYDEALTKKTLSSQHVEGNPEHLFQIGEYYYKQNNQHIAAYVYKRYLQLNPQGVKTKEVKERLLSLGDINVTAVDEQLGFNRTIPNGQMLFSEHEPGRELYIIQQGKIKITKIINEQEILIAVLNPGDIFGEMALLEDKPRNASAIAFGDCQLMAVNKANFDKIVIQNPQLSTKLIQLLSERVWTVYRQLGNCMIESPIGRLYDYLLLQLQKNHVNIVRKTAYLFGFGSDELIKMVGMNQEQGKAAMHELMKNNKISIRNNKLYCEDIEEIEKQVQYFQRMQALETKRKAAKLKQYN